MIKGLPNRKILLKKLPEKFPDSLPNGAGLYAVGGAIRDTLLAGCSPRELDILMTGVEVKNVLRILRRFGKARLVGQSFTVIKWHPKNTGRIVDVSLPSKRDISQPGETKFDISMSVEEDLAERDFTVDAMALNLITGKFLDPFGGQKDLKNGILRTVKDSSLRADPIRCLRAAYICARCRLAPDKKTLDMIKSAAPKLKHVAQERIGEELKKLMLELDKPSEALKLWLEWGLTDIILPELMEGVGVTQEGGWHAYDVFEHGLKTVDAAPRKTDVRLAALFHDAGKPRRRKYMPEKDRATFYGHQNVSERMAKHALKRLKFPGKTIDRVTRLVRNHMFTHAETDKGVRRFIRRVGEDILDELFELRYADIEAQGTARDDTPDRKYEIRVRKILKEKPPLSTRDLAIGGKDIMQILGIDESPEIGKVLNHLLEIVLDNPELNKKETLISEMHAFAVSSGIVHEDFAG